MLDGLGILVLNGGNREPYVMSAAVPGDQSIGHPQKGSKLSEKLANQLNYFEKGPLSSDDLSIVLTDPCVNPNRA